MSFMLKPVVLGYLQIAIGTLVLALSLQMAGAGNRFKEKQAKEVALATFDSEKSLLGTSISLSDLLQLIAQKGVILIDTRQRSEYGAGHLPGALNLQADTAVRNLPPTLWKSGPLIFYGAGYGSPSASAAAARMLNLGVSNVLVYQGGWQEWNACHLAVAQAMHNP